MWTRKFRHEGGITAILAELKKQNLSNVTVDGNTLSTTVTGTTISASIDGNILTVNTDGILAKTVLAQLERVLEPIGEMERV